MTDGIDIYRFAESIYSLSDSADRQSNARLRLFDWFIALHGGTQTGDDARAREAAGIAGSGKSPWFWTNTTSGAVEAALSLARVSRSSEIDDIHLTSCTTPGSGVVAAALPVTSLQDVPADQLLKAIIVGYEVVTRIGRAISGPLILYKGVWPSLLTAPIAAAATSCVALGGGSAELARAISSGGELAVLGRPRDGRDRYLTFGCAVASGVMAGTGAMLGKSSDTSEAWSWPDYLPIPMDTSELYTTDDSISETRIKPFCAGGQATQAIGLAFRHREDIGDPRAIARIRVQVPEQVFDMVKGNLGNTIGIALTSPDLLWTFSRGMASQEVAAEIAQKTTVTADESLSADFPRSWGAVIQVEFSDGQTLEWNDEDPVLAPLKSETQLLDKAKRVLPGGNDEIDDLLELCKTFDSLGELTSAMGSYRIGGSVPA